MQVHVDGIDLEVRDSGGQGEVVLLVHGWPDDGSLWDRQAQVLHAAGYRVLAPDLPGFGRSSRPREAEGFGMEYHVTDLIGLLDWAGAAQAHLVGHDWGAAISWAMASVSPQRVSSVTGISVGHPAVFAAGGYEQLQKSWYMLMFHFPGVAERWLHQGGLAEMLTEHPRREEVLRNLDDPGWLTSTLGIYRATLPPEVLLGPPLPLPPVSVPAMGVWSSGDRFLTEASVTATERHVTDSWRYERIDGAGHWPQLQTPERVDALLLDFLAAHGREDATTAREEVAGV